MKKIVHKCCGSYGNRHLKTCRATYKQVRRGPIKPLDEAKEEVIKAACAQRDHNWDEDGSHLIEALDDAVDEYRRSLAHEQKNQGETP